MKTCVEWSGDVYSTENFIDWIQGCARLFILQQNNRGSKLHCSSLIGHLLWPTTGQLIWSIMSRLLWPIKAIKILRQNAIKRPSRAWTAWSTIALRAKIPNSFLPAIKRTESEFSIPYYSRILLWAKLWKILIQNAMLWIMKKSLFNKNNPWKLCLY